MNDALKPGQVRDVDVDHDAKPRQMVSPHRHWWLQAFQALQTHGLRMQQTVNSRSDREQAMRLRVQLSWRRAAERCSCCGSSFSHWRRRTLRHPPGRLYRWMMSATLWFATALVVGHQLSASWALNASVAISQTTRSWATLRHVTLRSRGSRVDS